MSYFKSDGQYIYADAHCIEFYIPKYYFEKSSNFAEDNGSIIKVLGVFDIGILSNGTLKEMKVLNIPTTIELYVVDSEDRDVDLPGEDGLTPCHVLRYIKGQKIMRSYTIQDSSNVESYLNFINKGKVPSIVPYEKSLQLWRKNQELNGANLGVPSVIEELILSVSYRDKDDPSKKFSHVIGKDLNKSQFDYVMNNIRQICQYTSTFTAVTFEDLDASLTTSLNRTRSKGNEAVSPIEDLFKL